MITLLVIEAGMALLTFIVNLFPAFTYGSMCTMIGGADSCTFIGNAVSRAGFLSYWAPISLAVTCLEIVAAAWAISFTIGVILWLYAHIPWFGKG